ncbi:hypothetical protein C1645_840491 [Glomus cerebriforme]|uniref:F-box domain-containing protein n=1 Tax=Glomus cerebriforme TaxID=658196 RepID=A0A397RZ75_9GLOM|nr:hypothetical protein C1645_840491 [Glomus cerebriforme]
MSQLSIDCLSEIFKYLEKDIIALHSCLLVNTVWCGVSVRILWSNVKNYNALTFNTLITCLPDKSKKMLYKKKIIPVSTSKQPIFNYPSYCRVLSIHHIYYRIKEISLLTNCNKERIIKQEIFKLFMKQIPSLKKLYFHLDIPETKFISYPGAKDCLKNLSKLNCISHNISETSYQKLAQICHNIQSIKIQFDGNFTSKELNGWRDLISVQKNLKHLRILSSKRKNTDLLPLLTLTNLHNTLINFFFMGFNISLSFIAKFTNLQELELSLRHEDYLDFEKLLITFSQLQILNLQSCPRYELLIKFLEINGKNLKEFYAGEMMGDCDNLLNLSIAKFCTNLRKLSIGFKNNELETLKLIFNSCQYLESIKIWYGDTFLSEKDALEASVNYSPKNIHELILYDLGNVQLKLLPKELESFFISWTNRIPQKSISFIIVSFIKPNDEIIEIFEKYIKLGVIKKFAVQDD